MEKMNGFVCVSVENSGEIPQKDIGYVFNKFYQSDSSRSIQGNGIGLAIVKKILDLHSAEIFAESEAGTVRFTVKLPCIEE